MRTSSFLAPVLFAATGLAQAVPEGIAPSTAAPEGCVKSASSNFTIGTLKVGHKKRETAQDAANSALVCSLSDGVLRDRDGRTGSVVANRQFQFDGPPQAGAIYTGGFSICANGSLAIGGTTRWWQCSSGGFYNLYDEWIGAQCEEIRIQVDLLEKERPTSSVGAGKETPIASIESSLVTVTGAPSTISKSAVGPSASFSTGLIASGNASVTSAAEVTSSGSTTATASTSSGTSAASDLPAPPADGAAVSFGVAKGSLFAAFVVIFGAAIVL